MSRRLEYIVPHCEDLKPVVAIGTIENDFFNGEYKLNKMTFGCILKVKFKSFLEEKPKQHNPLIVKFDNGDIDHAYYVEWSNTIYPRYKTSGVAIEWCYRLKNYTK